MPDYLARLDEIIACLEPGAGNTGGASTLGRQGRFLVCFGGGLQVDEVEGNGTVVLGRTGLGIGRG